MPINEILVRPTEQEQCTAALWAWRRSAVALDDAVGDEVEQLPLFGLEARRRSSARLPAATISSARARTLLQRPGGGDPVAERLGGGGVEAVQVDLADAGVALRRPRSAAG